MFGGVEGNDTSMNQSGTFNQFNGMNVDNSESITNMQLNDASGRSMTHGTVGFNASNPILNNESSNITAQTAQWAK